MEVNKGNKKSGKKIIFGVLAVVVLAIITFSVHAGMVLSNDHIYSGVHVGKIDLSGMTEKQATEELSDYYDKKADAVLNFKCNDLKFKIPVESISFKADIEKAVKSAYNAGRDGNFFENYMNIMSYKKKAYTEKMSFSYDKDRLLLLINDNVQSMITDPVAMNVEIGEDKLFVTNALPGNGIDEEELYKDVNNVFEENSYDDIIDVLIVEKAAKNLTFKEFYEEYNRDAKDAVYTKTEDSFVIEPEVVGIELDKEETKRILAENVDNTEVYEIPAKITKPEVTAKMLEDKYVNKVIASYSTSLGGSTANRIANVALAASKINGYVLNPGKRFSYNKVVGPRTAATGFKMAHVYVGNEVVDGIGGGICQVSSTLYNAVVMSDLKIVSRTNHSMPVSYVPLGRDATVSYGSIDFVFENDKNYPVSIKAVVNGMTLTVSVVGTTDMDYTVDFVSSTVSTLPFSTVNVEDETLKEGETKTISNGSNGYVTNSYRVYKKNGKEYSRKAEAKSTYYPVPAKVAVGIKKEEQETEISENAEIPPETEENSQEETIDGNLPVAETLPQEDVQEVTDIEPAENTDITDDPLLVE